MKTLSSPSPLVLLVVLFATTAPANAAEVSGFRGVDWGSGAETIRQTDAAELLGEDDREPLHILLYEDTLLDLDVNVGYILVDDKLVRGKYIVTEQHVDDAKYLGHFQRLFTALSKKYGEPHQNETVWSNDLFRDDPSRYGMAVSMGHLTKYALWKTDGAHISILLNGDNFDVHLAIEYASTEYRSLEENASEKAAMDKL